MSLLSPAPGPRLVAGMGALPFVSVAIVDEYVSVSGTVEEGAMMLRVEDSVSIPGRMRNLGELYG